MKHKCKKLIVELKEFKKKKKKNCDSQIVESATIATIDGGDENIHIVSKGVNSIKS